MKALKLKKILAVAVAAVGLAAVAEPKVEITRVDVGNARDGVFAYTYSVSGVASGTCTIDVKITAGGGAKTKTETITRGNGDGNYVVDTKNDHAFGKVYTDVAVFMSIADSGSGSSDDSELWGVQLWPDGPYWAACNVGAETPGDAGFYFWWGGTIGYRYVDGKWTDTNGVQTNKFVGALCPTYNLDNNARANLGWLNSDGNLKAWCDAATANLGAPWRLMTSDELAKLTDTTYCTREWKENYKGTGVNGYLVKGAVAPYTNNEVFFPAAGYGKGSSLYDSGSGGFWSSTPDSDSGVAWSLDFGSSDFRAYRNGRWLGFPVRPVRGFAE